MQQFSRRRDGFSGTIAPVGPTPYTHPMPPAPPAGPARPLRRRWAAAGWVATAGAIIVGGPLFVRMPPWCDLTLYQVAARNLLDGGVLYHDVFDTNLPGFLVLLAGIQAVLGPSVAAVRLADLAIVAAAVWVLVKWVRRAGGGLAGAAWAAAGAAWFYLFTSEFCHAQRDVWMLLPAAAAAFRRARRTHGPVGGSAAAGFVDGLIWGIAVWIKPHVVVPALALWLATLPAAGRAWGWAAAGRDTLGLLAGGLVIGAAGLGLIGANGAWADFADVMTVWNPAYTARTLDEVPDRARWWITLEYFPPWSLLHVAALPLAGLTLVEGLLPARWAAGLPGWARFVYRPAAAAPERVARAALAVFYVSWFAQALVLQRGLDYVHVPEMLLAVAVLAGQGWAAAVPAVAGQVAIGMLLNAADANPWLAAEVRRRDPEWATLPLDKPPFLDGLMVRRWPDCFRGDTPELRDALARAPAANSTATWVDLGRVAAFLRTADPPARDGDLLAFHDSPHPLYLMLGVKPAARYMHVGTAIEIVGMAGRVADDIRAGRPRYVVGDLRRMTWHWRRAADPGWGGDARALPWWFPASQLDLFPWDQTLVFRAGRYCVYRVDRPIGEVRIPAWEHLGSLGPGVR